MRVTEVKEVFEPPEKGMAALVSVDGEMQWMEVSKLLYNITALVTATAILSPAINGQLSSEDYDRFVNAVNNLHENGHKPSGPLVDLE